MQKHHGVVRTGGWRDRLGALLAHELAPSSRRLWTSLRLTTIAVVGAALIAICHVNNELGTYIVWLLVGAGPMMSVRKASGFLAGRGGRARFLSGDGAGICRDSLADVAISVRVHGAFHLHRRHARARNGHDTHQIFSLSSFYGVVFAAQEIGWTAAGAFGGSAIAFGVILLFDNWLWPDPAEPILMKMLGASAAHERSRLVEATKFYLDDRAVHRPPEPPPTSDLPDHLALLSRAIAEGATSRRHAVHLAAITRMAGIHIEVDRLIVSARENVGRNIRAMLRPEIAAAADAIAEALGEIARDAASLIRTGPDQPPSPKAARARSPMDALNTRISEARPEYIATARVAELANFARSTTVCWR